MQELQTGEVGAQKVHDGSAGTSTALVASDIDPDRLLTFPRRTPMSHKPRQAHQCFKARSRQFSIIGNAESLNKVCNT